MIDVGKKYRTRSGRPARVICTDIKDTRRPVIAAITCCNDYEEVHAFTARGTFYQSDKTHDYDLIEVDPYEDFKTDDPVLVRDEEDGEWEKRHFSHSKNGKPYTFMSGCTSWTSSGGTVTWNYCKGPKQGLTLVKNTGPGADVVSAS